ncbi:MAG TPA: HlyD family efflux transporter periplasmic adaptor subunit [Thermoanaerobaculia bacterium]|jgi:HlyD family secretion protein|nr:HlyD family efflux transporter periplasmic adaptor subunit [Thermoanaerobaculia bacterium]
MNPKKIVIPVVLLAAAGAGAWYAFGRPKEDESKLAASGTVEATETQLGFQATGRILEIAVREGDRVRAGQVVARLDPSEAESRRAQAAGQVEAARALVAELERGTRSEEIAQGRAGLAAAEDRLKNAESDYQRNQILYNGGAISREALDNSRLARDVARSQRTQAAEQVRFLVAGPSKEKIAQARAQLVQAEAALRTSEVILGNLVITSPFDGLVTVRHREPGEIVPAGSPVLTLINPADRWVRIYIKEDRVGAVHLGGRAAISSDTYPGKSYPGQVAFIASEAEFTPRNVQTTEERVKLVYAVKVRILGDPRFELKPGLPADVRLEEAPPATYKGAVPGGGDVRSETSPPGPLSLTGEGGPSTTRFVDSRPAFLAITFECVPPRPSGRGGQGVRLRRVDRLAPQSPSVARG